MSEIIGPGNDRWSSWNAPQNLIEIDIEPPPVFTESITQLSDRVRELVAKLSWPKTLTAPHAAIGKLLSADELRAEKQRNSPYPSFYDAPLFASPFERRRLKILNSIFTGLHKAGFQASCSGKDPKEFYAQIGQQSVSFTLDGSKPDRNGYRSSTENNRPASDILRFEISNWQRPEGIQLVWQDEKDDKVEEHIGEILVSLIVAGEMQYRTGEERKHIWLVERKAALIEEAHKRKVEEERQARERRAKAEKARVDRLLAEAVAYRQALDIRAYVTTVTQENDKARDPVPVEALTKWAEWALKQANRIDPVLTKAFLDPMQDEDPRDELATPA
ncbi:MAG TPA: hypothetical protein VGO34_09925 [Alphaproteobacteria bacterium]|jgi:hypothetical protein